MTPSPALAATRARTDAGWLFAASFRPFFLGASLYAAAAVPIWVWMYFSGGGDVAGMPALTWHAHEMVFGFLPAVMAGYLLSSTPNWSGKLVASGRPLAMLFALWIAGRLVPLVAPFAVGTLADAAFPLAVALVLLREARLKASGQSRHGLILFPVLAAASIAHRMLADDHEMATTLLRVGVAVAALLIAAVGGRLVPSFTRNALAKAGAERVPEPYGRFDIYVLFVASAGLVAWIAVPAASVSAALMILAALLHAIRLARWRGWLLRDGSTLALHAGYAWLALGTLLAGLAAEPLAMVPLDAALHALTAGAIGTMTMAVMARLAMTRGAGTRASAGLCLLALIGVNIGAALRIASPLLADNAAALLVAGAVVWSGAYLLFALAQMSGRLTSRSAGR